jgi:hypothetical protein
MDKRFRKLRVFDTEGSTFAGRQPEGYRTTEGYRRNCMGRGAKRKSRFKNGIIFLLFLAREAAKYLNVCELQTGVKLRKNYLQVF